MTMEVLKSISIFFYVRLGQCLTAKQHVQWTAKIHRGLEGHGLPLIYNALALALDYLGYLKVPIIP